ncbi:hypothetical protein PIB30_039824 [Stylosanthes scabra]|uniref:Protein FAR1-RELATED SEQUENCE n=1 Tax=Stylosanthes scabra TaxID=79078 RepID=A0ABU6RF48_9FABA|nr:hypothetical protein [Stylosanthes scabra]
MSIYSDYEVVFCTVSDQVRCNYLMFESSGILCYHALSVLSKHKIDKIDSSYILSRWSKNVHRKHTHIKSSHDSRCSAESMNLFRGLCFDFFNVAQDFVHDKEEDNILRSAFMGAIFDLREHRAKKSKSVGSRTTKTLPTPSECPIGLNALKSPPCMALRGRPTLKRLGADMDRNIKKATKKRREHVAVEEGTNSNMATKRKVNARKHPKAHPYWNNA